MRSLVGDTAGDFCTDAYLNPLVNTVYEAQTTKLMADTDGSFDEWVFDIPSLPPGTTSLTEQQKQGGKLNGLVEPVCVEWKQAGQPISYYVEAARTGKLPNVSPAAPFAPYAMQWQWLNNLIYLTPVSFSVDLQVTGEFSPPTLVKDTDILIVHPRMGTATAFGTAALIGVERGNPGWIQNYGAQAEDVLMDIANKIIKGEQGTTTRIGRLGGNNEGGYGNGGLYA